MTMSLIASGTRSWRRCNRGGELSRVLTARFMHETNTFSRVKTDMALIRRRDFHLENETPQAFHGTRSALGATFEAAGKYGWTVHPVSVRGGEVFKRVPIGILRILPRSFLNREGRHAFAG